MPKKKVVKRIVRERTTMKLSNKNIELHIFRVLVRGRMLDTVAAIRRPVEASYNVTLRERVRIGKALAEQEAVRLAKADHPTWSDLTAQVVN